MFAPTRDEYIDLVADAPWPEGVERPDVWDIGTATGVLSAEHLGLRTREELLSHIRSTPLERANAPSCGN